jgi:hypothetical protein
MNPLRPAGRARAVTRGGRILQRLRQLGVLSDPEYQLAQTQLAALCIELPRRRPLAALHPILALARQLERDRPQLTAAGHYLIRSELGPGDPGPGRGPGPGP